MVPIAVLLPPVVLLNIDCPPTEVFPDPVVLLKRDEAPKPVFKLPVVLLVNEYAPTPVWLQHWYHWLVQHIRAVSRWPVLFERKDSVPIGIEKPVVI